jgi:hypothetical protein
MIYPLHAPSDLIAVQVSQTQIIPSLLSASDREIRREGSEGRVIEEGEKRK